MKIQNGTIRGKRTLYENSGVLKLYPQFTFLLRVATYDSLVNNGILLGSKRCVISETYNESICHLFFTYRVVITVDFMCFCVFLS